MLRERSIPSAQQLDRRREQRAQRLSLGNVRLYGLLLARNHYFLLQRPSRFVGCDRALRGPREPRGNQVTP